MNDIPNRSAEPLPVWVRGLIAALITWCVFLAVGASSAFGRGSLVFDMRRSGIVLACSALFLGGWFYVLLRRPGRPTAGEIPTGAWNQASLLSVVLALAGYSFWGSAWLAKASAQTLHLMAPLGYLSAAALGAATISAMVGLSNPRRRRGHLLGLATLGLLLLAVLLFIVQVATYAERRLG